MQACFCSPASLASARVSTTRRPRACARAQAEEDSASATFGKDVRTLLCGELTGAARSILAQDLAKRAPEAFEDALQTRGFGGLADFSRQLRRDIVPDLLSNSASYASAMQSAAERARRTSVTPVRTLPTLEEVAQEVRNVYNETPEGLYQPAYEEVSRTRDYTIRKYERMILASTRMEPSDGTEASNATGMGEAFTTLASYLFGENESNTAMKMTTPVFLDKGTEQESMSFVIGEYGSVEDVPKASGDRVSVRELTDTAQLYACVRFSGYATAGEMRRQHARLLELLERDGVALTPGLEQAYKCVIYNGPTTLPFRRRQELLVAVEPTAEADRDLPAEAPARESDEADNADNSV